MLITKNKLSKFFNKHLTIIFVLIITFKIVSADKNNLKQIHIIFRHGERAPTETYNTDPHKNYTWPGGWGHLTNRGKFQMYSLGIKFKETYKTFIPRYYHAHVNVSSSYADRCLMSAEALLAGWFPPIGEQIWNEQLLWQPIAVHYLPRSQDNLLAMKAKCDKYDKEFSEIFKSEKFKQIDEDNAELYSYLTQMTGQPIRDIGDVERLSNTLEIEILNNLTLPDWTKNISLPHLKRLAARNLAAFTETDFMKKMKGGVFIKHVITSLKNDVKTLLYLYAAHDLTLVNILRTLGSNSVNLKPGFGASLIFELYHDLEVKMIYRDDIDAEPVTIYLPNCAEKCYLDKFEAALKDFLPEDWNRECNQ